MIERSLLLGDNLEMMKGLVGGCAHLVYLDPPFNTNRSFSMTGKAKKAGSQGFMDKWKWGDEAKSSLEAAAKDPEWGPAVTALHTILGDNDMTAYLAMMAPRLGEIKRLLADGGSVFLHCDPTSSHYLKVLCDAVMGRQNFKNEIIWHYRRWTNAQKQFQRMHDVILFYRLGEGVFDPPEVPPTGSQAEVIQRGWNVNKVRDGGGKALQLLVYDRDKAKRAIKVGKLDPSRYDRVVYRDSTMSAASDTWTDIQYLHSQAKEREGYPTQKPLALLERIITTCTREGDLVLDPFSGCGTTLVAAEKLSRRWAGMDMNPEAIKISKSRMKKEFGIKL